MHDVVVVGAGPVGTHAARLLAAAGHDVLVLEEHPVVGNPVQCAGLVTTRVFDHAPFAVGELWQNDLRGAIVHAPNGDKISFDAGRPRALAMDRGGFDREMARHAAMAGADIRTSTKAVAVKVGTEHAAITVQEDGARREVHAKMVIGADGIRSNVARWSGLPPVQEVVSCYEAELDGCTIPDPGMIPMFAGHAKAPGFFSWIIPVGGDRARAGLAVAPGMNEVAAKRYYERMFTDPLSRPYLAAARESHLIIGGIPLGLRPRLVDDRVAVVGDAAGMAKPTSGGGIHTGMVAAEHLARVVSRGLAKDRLDAGSLFAYQRAVAKTVAPELRRGDLLRKMYTQFSDADFDHLATLLATPRCRNIIESIGDIDYPSRLVWPLIRAQPRLAGLFLRMMLEAP